MSNNMRALDVSDPESDAVGRNKGRLRIGLILLALYLSTFIAAIDATIVSTALPIIVSEFHSASGYTWIGGSFVLARACTIPIWAKFSDVWGRKPIILINIGLFTISSVLCGAARSIVMLLFGRAVQGVASGALLQLPMITISDLFSLRQRSLFLGLTQLVFALAAGVGPVLGGTLAELVSWRWIFWINLPTCAVAFLLIVFLLDVHNPRTKIGEGLKAIDWVGTVAIIGLTLMILLALDFGGVIYPWNSPKVVCLLVFGGLLCVFFAFNEVNLARNPLIPLKVFHNRSNVACLAICFLQSMVFMAGEYFLPLFFQSAKQASPIQSGVLVLPLVVSTSMGAMACGIFIHRTGEYLHPMRLGFLFLSLGTGLYILFRSDTPNGTIIGFEIIAGMGVGLVFQPPVIAIQARVSPEDTATATAAFGFVRNLGTAFSIVAGGVLFQNGMKLRAPHLNAAGLAPELVQEISGPEAAANIEMVGTIEDDLQRQAVQDAYAWSMRNLWILYTCIAVVGGVASFFVRRCVLSKEHTEHRTGLKKEGSSVEGLTDQEARAH